MSYATLYNPATHQVDQVNGTLRVVGSNGFISGECTQTGFYVRKYMDDKLDRALAIRNGSTQPYMELRYAEVLLNYAEAAAELGKTADAKAKINMVRERAGIALLDDASTTVSRVRHERFIELAFENHRYWDVRRWRIAHEIWNNLSGQAIRPYWDIQANAYRFERAPANNRFVKTFEPKLYYEMINTGQMAQNPKLIQNPGY
jgi:starch-binding outer membrane protein, SusD/RagB family